MNVSTVYYQLLSDHLDKLSPFFSDMDALFCGKYPDSSSILSVFLEKKALILDGSVDGIMVFQGDKAVGVAWVEKVGPRYGSLLCHCMHGLSVSVFATCILESDLTNNVLLELSQFADLAVYQSAFEQLDYRFVFRQRMALDLLQTPVSDDYALDDPAGKLSFCPLVSLDSAVSAEISFAAHNVSLDQIHCPDMNTLSGRLSLERDLFKGVYGTLIEPASLVLLLEGEPIGLISIVDIACWGFDHLPWIFDVALLPAYHGRGYGNVLLKQALFVLQSMSFEMVGLAATLSNTLAIGLYERLNFFFVETFVEMIQERDI